MGAIIYHHRQFGPHVILSFLAATALIGATAAALLREQPLLLTVSFAAFSIVALVHYLLSSLTVEVSEEYLTWHFASGLCRRRVARAEIVRVEQVRLPWWYGLGVKYTPSAWVYLVAPGDGIKIALASGKAVCIGTDDTESLMVALRRE
jgi:hypothetical protein